MRCTIRNELDVAEPREFWEHVFFSKDAQERIYRELGCHEARVVVQEGNLDDGLRREFTFVQPLATPGPLKAVFGDRQRLTEHGEFDAARQEYRFEMVPDGKLSERIRVRGVTRVERTAGGRIERVCELDCSCSIPAVGGLTERFMVRSNEQIYARRTAIEQRLLAARRG